MNFDGIATGLSDVLPVAKSSVALGDECCEMAVMGVVVHTMQACQFRGLLSPSRDDKKSRLSTTLMLDAICASGWSRPLDLE